MKAKAENAQVRAPRVRDLPPADYANYVAANHTSYELTIFFGQVSTPGHALDREDLGDPPVIEAKYVARVSIPVALLEPTIKVLQGQADKIKEELNDSEE